MKKSILFVSNDQTLCESLSLFLSAWYPASCIRSLPDLEAHLEQHGGSLALIDLPLSEGLVKRIREIKEKYPDLMIVFMAVHQSYTAALEAQLSPCVSAWLYKPVDVDEVRKSVDNLLGSSTIKN